MKGLSKDCELDFGLHSLVKPIGVATIGQLASPHDTYRASSLSGSHPEPALPLIQPSLVLVYSHALATDFPELQAVLVLTKTGCKQVPLLATDPSSVISQLRGVAEPGISVIVLRSANHTLLLLSIHCSLISFEYAVVQVLTISHVQAAGTCCALTDTLNRAEPLTSMALNI